MFESMLIREGFQKNVNKSGLLPNPKLIFGREGYLKTNGALRHGAASTQSISLSSERFIH